MKKALLIPTFFIVQFTFAQVFEKGVSIPLGGVRHFVEQIFGEKLVVRSKGQIQKEILKFEVAESSSQVEIFDNSDKVMLRGEALGSDGEFEMDVESLSAGSYYLQLIYDRNLSIYPPTKFIKE